MTPKPKTLDETMDQMADEAASALPGQYQRMCISWYREGFTDAVSEVRRTEVEPLKEKLKHAEQIAWDRKCELRTLNPDRTKK